MQPPASPQQGPVAPGGTPSTPPVGQLSPAERSAERTAEPAKEPGRLRSALHGFKLRFRAFQARARRTRTGALTLRIVVTLVGLLVILAGIIMLIGPGQGILAIILGLAILATEYPWAERMMHNLKERMDRAAQRAREMDPAVRRRRIIGFSLASILIVGGGLWAVSAYGWPDPALDAWDAAQGIFPSLPELPWSPPSA